TRFGHQDRSRTLFSRATGLRWTGPAARPPLRWRAATAGGIDAVGARTCLGASTSGDHRHASRSARRQSPDASSGAVLSARKPPGCLAIDRRRDRREVLREAQTLGGARIYP